MPAWLLVLLLLVVIGIMDFLFNSAWMKRKIQKRRERALEKFEENLSAMVEDLISRLMSGVWVALSTQDNGNILMLHEQDNRDHLYLRVPDEVRSYLVGFNFANCANWQPGLFQIQPHLKDFVFKCFVVDPSGLSRNVPLPWSLRKIFKQAEKAVRGK